jgi:hypothetical protein
MLLTNSWADLTPSPSPTGEGSQNQNQRRVGPPASFRSPSGPSPMGEGVGGEVRLTHRHPSHECASI